MIEYDLHIHSTVSDGTLTPYEIIDRAAALGLKGIAITDHDDISTDHIGDYACRKGIDYFYGIEFSTNIPNLHILAYGLDLKAPLLREYLKDQKQEREKAIRAMCKKAQKMGLVIDFNELKESNTRSFGRPHLADLMVKKGYTRDVYEAFQKYLKNGRPVFVDYRKFSFRKILEIITQCNGLPVLAHPAMLRGDLFHSVFSEAMKHGLKGLEVYYPRHTREQKKHLKRLAGEHGLMITGGSDFHGAIKPDIEMGNAGLNREEFLAFREALVSR